MVVGLGDTQINGTTSLLSMSMEACGGGVCARVCACVCMFFYAHTQDCICLCVSMLSPEEDLKCSKVSAPVVPGSQILTVGLSCPSRLAGKLKQEDHAMSQSYLFFLPPHPLWVHRHDGETHAGEGSLVLLPIGCGSPWPGSGQTSQSVLVSVFLVIAGGMCTQ